MTALRTEIISDIAALAEIEAEWWALWRRCPNATPFQTPAWLLAWWRSFAPGSLATVAVWRESRLAGLAPLYAEERTHRLLPLGIGISDYLDVLVDPASATEVGQAFGAALDAVPAWTELCLEELEPQAAALALPAHPGWTDERSPQSACPVLSLPAGHGLADVVPAPKLRKLRMARHRVARRGGGVERADAASAREHLEALFRLHAARWESRGERGVLADERVRRFHETALPGLAAADVLRSSVLRIGGRIAGVFYGFRAGDSFCAYLGGFDPGFAFESPGTVLMGHAIEDAIREGAREFHLLRGQEAYKYDWGARDRCNTRRVLGRDTSARAARPGPALRLARALTGRLEAGAPPNVALMHLLMAAAAPGEARDAVTRAISLAQTGAVREGAKTVAALLEANPDSWATVRAITKAVKHEPASSSPESALAYWAAAFDRLARTAPEPGVALYALGNPDLLAAATAEVVAFLETRGLLGPQVDVLDLGCGTGRFARALAPRVRSVLGLDLSGEMVAECRRRGASPNVRFEQSSGRDLGAAATAGFDLLLAADVFPYLVQAGGGLAEAHLREAARVLRPGGSLVLLNYSYRGDAALDRSDVARHAEAFGFDVVRAGTREFRFWDATTFHLVGR